MAAGWKRKKYIRILIGIAVFIAVYALLFLIGLRNFSDYFTKEFKIPGITEWFVPRGIFYDESADVFLVSGYVPGHRPSRIYLAEGDTGSIRKRISLQKEDGSGFNGHAGGICSWDKYIYIAATWDGVYVYDREEVLNCPDGGTVKALGLFPVTVGEENVKASFLTVHDGVLTVGEYYFGFLLSTPKSHHFQTPFEERTKALAIDFPLQKGQPLGILPEASAAYTLPKYSQGICFNNGRVLVSTAPGIITSRIFVYNLSESEVFDTFGGIPVYALDHSSVSDTYTFLPLIEEINCKDGKLYAISEAASHLYNFGKILGANYCYSIPFP